MNPEPRRDDAGEAAKLDSWTLAASAITGRGVVTADGQRIGTVVDLHLDLGTWHVTSMEVRLDRPMHRTLGVKRELVHRTTMTLPTHLIHAVKDTVILATSTAELRDRASDAASVH